MNTRQAQCYRYLSNLPQRILTHAGLVQKLLDPFGIPLLGRFMRQAMNLAPIQRVCVGGLPVTRWLELFILGRHECVINSFKPL